MLHKNKWLGFFGKIYIYSEQINPKNHKIKQPNVELVYGT